MNPFFGIQGASVHPPFTEIIFHYFGEFFGYLQLRWLILLFAIACFWLVYAIAREQYGRRAALFSLALFAVIPYNVIANIQIDIDGAILPLWILLTLWGFMRLDVTRLRTDADARWWLGVFAVGIIGGLLSKISFILIVPGLWFYAVRRYGLKINYALIGKTLAGIAATGVVLAVLLWLLHVLYPALSPLRFLEYTTHFSFFNFADRNYFQVLFLTTKAVLLLSPFLALLLAGLKPWRRYEFWWWYIISGLLFYLVLFDFSNRTIDRYMMFLILPLVFIGGDVLARAVKDVKTIIAPLFVSAAIFAAGGALLVSSFHEILPLVPKTAYIQHVKDLDPDFVLPFSSGSGPIGFYMSMKFILLFWAIALVSLLAYFYSRKFLPPSAAIGIFLAVASVYSLFFNAELAYGWAYGSPDAVAAQVLRRAVDDPAITKVITYNDTGTYELDRAGKHQGRFYTQPIFENSARGRLAQNRGYYTVVDFPEINKASVFWAYLQSCETVLHVQDKRVNGYVFNCQTADPALLTAE